MSFAIRSLRILICFVGQNFTDDSVMTLAVAKWLLEDSSHTIHYLIYCMQELGNHHPNAGYGGRFAGWLYEDNPQPYNSWGNGAGMRVSPVGLYAKTRICRSIYKGQPI